MQRLLALMLAGWLCVTAPTQGWGAEVATTAIGRTITDFTLRDFRGTNHQLAEFADKKLVVVAFLGTECPLAKLYAPRLQALHATYEPQGVAFVGINSNRQDSNTEVTAYATQHALKFPILKDLGNAVADQFAAVRTPEVFILDNQGVVQYQGRIDDQFGVGVRRKAATRNDLEEAIKELLNDQPVSVTSTPAAGCIIGRVAKQEPSGNVTYSNQIASLMQNRCVNCHRAGEIAPFPLTSYEEVVGWADTIAEVVADQRMPPWFASPEHGKFLNDARLTPEEKQLVADWVAGGAPEGDPAQLPTARAFAEGWQISQPDLVIHLRDNPYRVPADGVVEYQYFVVDPGFKEDKWIKAAEARPDNRAVVHHIVATIIGPNEKPRGFGGNRGLIGYAPGMPPVTYPEGAALFVEAGSKIVFQMHYTPIGTEQYDRSSLGLVFVDPATVKFRMGGGAAPNGKFVIPPGADNHEVTSSHVFKQDARLVNLTPHMHLRGKAFKFELKKPDGTLETLLDIPRFDFNWQMRYELAEPLLVTAGSELLCTAHFDNSDANLANPDPTAEVRWGDQTWEEMMIGYFSTMPIEPNVNVASGE